MSGPLSGLRVVATMPPPPWFGGVDYNFAVEMTDELRTLGAEVFEVDVAAFTTQNDVYIQDVIQAVRSFRPDVGVSLPNSLYVLLC
ncbi:MAG TPA: hypothetical protein VGV35_15040, partial [Bryobacteraceae bacterium]|nr:hypothetical protein [Bryobacteraceae bacterium]